MKLDVTETNEQGHTWWVVYPHWSGQMKEGNDRRYRFCNVDQIADYVIYLNNVPYVRKSDYRWAARLADGFVNIPHGHSYINEWGSSIQFHLRYKAFDWND